MRTGPLVRCLAVLGVAIALPLVIRDQYRQTILVLVGINVILVTGLQLLMGYAGQISLGHAAFVAVGAYTSGVLSLKAGLPPLLGIFGGICLSCAIALVLAIPTMRLTGYYVAMATLGFGVIVQIALEHFRDLTGGISGLVDIPPLSLGAYVVETEKAYYYLVLSIVTLALWFSRNYTRSRQGRALLAIHTNELAAEVRGIPTFRLKIQVFVLSAGLAALAGGLYAHFIRFISPGNFGVSMSILSVLMVIVGGMGSLGGGVLGATLLTFLPELLRSVGELEELVYGMVLLVVMFLLPGGLMQGWRRLAGRFGGVRIAHD